MTAAELAAIAARRYDWWNCGVPDFSDAKVCSDQAHRDRDALLAEVQRLRGLVEAAYREGQQDGDGPKLWHKSDAKRLLDGGTE